MASQIPGYQVIRKIGEGGMSTVYLAIQLSVGREVALKVLSPKLRHNKSFAEKFYREANTLGLLSHPNIINVYDIGTHGEHYYMAMDYLSGASCKDLITSSQITPIQALRIVHDINAALGYVHEQGYLHLDIKPDNILFRQDGSAVLSDFGIAKEKLMARKSKNIAGTPHYMSPEQAQGLRLDERSDIYSLGVLFYELLTGLLPFHANDAVEIAIKHVSSPVPQLPEELNVFSPLVNSLLAKRPGARMQNATEIAHALDFVEARYLKHESQSVPFKVKASLYWYKILHASSSLATLRSRLNYSFKHGLVLRLAESEKHIPQVGNLTTGLAETAEGLTTQNTSKDSIAVALESAQAKKIASTTTIALAFGFVLLIFFMPDLFSACQQLISNLSQPEIIYVD